MHVTNHAGAPDAVFASIKETVQGHSTLEQVLRWGLSQSPRRNVDEIVTQDEYTHDVLVPFDRGYYLVYDVT